MKQLYIIYPSIFFLISTVTTNAQNLVPNFSFEGYNNCPTTFSQIINTGGYGPFPTVLFWNNPCQSTSDYFNECASVSSDVNIPNTFAGFAYARSGKGMAGIIAVNRNGQAVWHEYIQTRLTTKLKVNTEYSVSFFVRYADYRADSYPIDKLGVHFSKDMLNDTMTFLKVSTHVANTHGRVLDSLEWVKISGTYLASGNEEYMTIGSFVDGGAITIKGLPSTTTYVFNYYFIDDVWVSEREYKDTMASLVVDTNFCLIDTLGLIAHPLNTDTFFNYRYMWNTGDTTPAITITKPRIYWRTAWSDYACYIDTYRIRYEPLITNRKFSLRTCKRDTTITSGLDSYLQSFWSTGDTGRNLTVTESGVYVCRTELADCSYYIDTFYIEILNAAINLTLGNDTTVCTEDNFIIGQEVPNATSYSWNNGFTGCCFRPIINGKYILIVSNDCYETSDEVEIQVTKCDHCIIVPSAFTPNNDGLNDMLSVISLCHDRDMQMNIYDRWGTLVFQTNNLADKWDGKYNGSDAEIGVYYYYLQYYSIERERNIISKGDITLIR